MAFVVKSLKTIRNNSKKSAFGAVVLAYGYDWGREYLEVQELMRVYCEEASKYGDQPIPLNSEPRNLTIILNPNANKRKANEDFEKYCAPIFHLAGVCVNILKTESEGHAKNLVNDVNNTDAIVVAGGDGTLSEVITGLLRRTNENTEALIPLGLLPLGRTNSSASDRPTLGTKVDKVKALAEAALAVVNEYVKPVDVLKIEQLEDDTESKPIYAVGGVKWGAYRDAENKQDSYWLYGKLRKYATYIFNGYKSSLTWDCKALVQYSPPCVGCANCIRIQNEPKRWYQKLSKTAAQPNLHVLNPQCVVKQEREVETVDFTLSVAKSEIPKLELKLGPSEVDYLSFVKEGWKSQRGENRSVSQVIEARSIDIRPKIDSTDRWFSIDNENFELKPVRVTLLPKLVKMFCKKDNIL